MTDAEVFITAKLKRHRQEADQLWKEGKKEEAFKKLNEASSFMERRIAKSLVELEKLTREFRELE